MHSLWNTKGAGHSFRIPAPSPSIYLSNILYAFTLPSKLFFVNTSTLICIFLSFLKFFMFCTFKCKIFIQYIKHYICIVSFSFVLSFLLCCLSMLSIFSFMQHRTHFFDVFFSRIFALLSYFARHASNAFSIISRPVSSCSSVITSGARKRITFPYVPALSIINPCCTHSKINAVVSSGFGSFVV